ncbi:glycosyltransferase (plasmid) [Photobacterium sp. DA100]|uniref:glycosyltransferase family 2 protein n=1 Tax=Photobacterium sp. DA100 TaxID=3027472 RepID=UPI00247AA616|nr:glycosyltransferase [Photobacterium sp. DA100]WEM45363.1 glycosyltransferase [Photobacterium sp. DA100]
MVEWLLGIIYILVELCRNTSNILYILVLFFPMLLAFELPLMLLTYSGLFKWAIIRYQSKPQHYHKRLPNVSCIVTCYSEGDSITITIDSLREQRYPGKIEIIAVIDGASQNPETYQAALCSKGSFKNNPERELVILPKWQRGGRVSTLNSGLAIAKGEIIINVDGDTSFDNNMVDEIIHTFDDPNVPAVAGALRVRNLNDSLVTRMQGIEYIISLLGCKTGLSEWNLINNISGAFGAFRRDFLVNIGGWDTHTAEDLDLTIRIKHYLRRHPNLRIPFSPLAVGYTNVPNTVISLAKQRLRWDGDLLFLYLRKHIFSLTPRLLGWKTFIYTLVFGIVQSILLPLLMTIHLWWLVFTYPSKYIAAILLLLYIIHLIISAFSYIYIIVVISEKPFKDLKLLLWLLAYPIYTFSIRMWATVAILNELFRRSHEESGMAPWWVIKRGHKFHLWKVTKSERNK